MPDGTNDLYIENRPFAALTIGESASLSHTVTQRDIDLFTTVTGDVSPAHVDPAYAATDMFHHIIIQGHVECGPDLCHTGHQAARTQNDLPWTRPAIHQSVSIGDTVNATVTIREPKPAKDDVVLDCICTNQHGQAVITGTAYVRAPTEKIRVRRVTLPEVCVYVPPRQNGGAARAGRSGGAITAAVVYPADATALLAALDAARRRA